MANRVRYHNLGPPGQLTWVFLFIDPNVELLTLIAVQVVAGAMKSHVPTIALQALIVNLPSDGFTRRACLARNGSWDTIIQKRLAPSN